ncbi:MAG: AIM24 family protein [Actinomycetota bacterium]|jgi:uncharacterized protein (AIM24 family)|nr:AIM24 family protein [Actinomycetota bacterium]
MPDTVSPGVATTLNDFVAEHSQRESGGTWQLESNKMLEVHLNNELVYTKMGSMVAYYGDMKFERASSGGVAKFVKKSMTGEGTSTTMVTGSGILYCADQGKEISIVYLNNQTIFVNGTDLLAYSASLEWDIVRTKGAGMMAGGLFSLKLTGTGFAAITTHGKPMVLGVSPEVPLFADPNATVAWSEGLQMTFKADMNLKTFVGRASGETFQMRFDGTGFVVLQPYEEIAAPTGNG